MKIMNISSPLRPLPQLLALLLALACTLPLIHAKVGEQENWYLDREWKLAVSHSHESSHSQKTFVNIDSENNLYHISTSGDYFVQDDRFRLTIFDQNGSRLRSIYLGGQSKLRSIRDFLISPGYNGKFLTNSEGELQEDANVSIFIASPSYISCLNLTTKTQYDPIENESDPYLVVDSKVRWTYSIGYIPNEPSGSGFMSLALNRNGKLYCGTETGTVVVIDQDGNYIETLSIPKGNAPGQLTSVEKVRFLRSGELLLSGGYYINFFTEEGEFIKRGPYDLSDINSADQLICGHILRDKDFNYITNLPVLGKWTNNGDIISEYSPSSLTYRGNNDSSFSIWKRAYRTKGLPTPNGIPQPVVRSIAQRPGTNILDIDFEIIDPDDNTATAGLLGTVAIEEFDDLSKLIIPSSLIDGTDSLIGQPIATNEVHRVSWYVKGDWSELTGDLKVGVFAQDARRSMPVDLHFLKIPTEDGNLTISRSPLKDSDMLNYFQYLLSIGDPRVSLNDGKIVDSSGATLMYNPMTPESTKPGRDFFMNDLGYRWANIAEVSIAREAATPGTVNSWDATNQVKPRNLPNRVNEYGFDTGSTGWWVVKESSLPIPLFNSLVIENNSSENEGFGTIISMHKNQILVGRKEADYYDRSAFLYNASENTTSILSSSLIEPKLPSSENSKGFGYTSYWGNLVIESDLAAISANGAIIEKPDGVSHYEAGAVFLYDLTNGTTTQMQIITASDVSEGDFFGNAIDLDGDLLIAGSFLDDRNGVIESGTAYLFQKKNDGLFEEIAKLQPGQDQPSMHFGHSVSVNNGIIAIGAINEDIKTEQSERYGAGAVYLYKLNDDNIVSFTQRIQSPSVYWNAEFGNAITMDGQWLVVGEKNANPGYYAWGTGAAHIYKIKTDGTAELTTSIYSPEPTEQGYFAHSVAIDGDRLVIGAPGEDSDNGSQSGVVYVYQVLEDGKVRLLESLIHPTGKANDQFGQSVSISGLNILVGAPGYDLDNDRWNAGSAVLFRASQ